jgi:zinc transport system permease protein
LLLGFFKTFLRATNPKSKTQVLEAFLLQPLLAVILIAISCSTLGVFVLWKKLSYFGDALSHAVLLGLAFSVIFEMNQILALIIFAIIFAALVTTLAQNRFFSKDIIIMISSYFCVAIAIILNDVWIKDFNFASYIFGDVLAVSDQEIQALAVISVATISYVIFAFKKILLININQDLARIENVKTEIWNFSFLLLLALVIALSVKIVGVFLMTALLILPAAIARIFSTSAKQMMLLSLAFGIIVSSTSFKLATSYDLTVSPVIIAIFSIIFICSISVRNFLSR